MNRLHLTTADPDPQDPDDATGAPFTTDDQTVSLILDETVTQLERPDLGHQRRFWFETQKRQLEQRVPGYRTGEKRKRA